MIFMNKFYKIFLNSLPIIGMVGSVPLIKNDYYLFLAYLLIICISFAVKIEHNEWLVFVFGFFIMIFFEYIFISTGVEVFYRNSLFGLMPIWLPLLWAYGFVGIKRAVEILEK